MGRDFWPYGVAANRKALNLMLGYAHRHGTTDRLLRLDQVFAPSTLATSKV